MPATSEESKCGGGPGPRPKNALLGWQEPSTPKIPLLVGARIQQQRPYTYTGLSSVATESSITSLCRGNSSHSTQTRAAELFPSTHANNLSGAYDVCLHHSQLEGCLCNYEDHKLTARSLDSAEADSTHP